MPAASWTPEVPSPAQFNHVITVVANAGGRYIWLDTTPEVAPYSLLMLATAQQTGAGDSYGRAPTADDHSGESSHSARQSFPSEGKLTLQGTFTGHVEQSIRGDVRVLLRAVFRQLSQSQWKEGVQRFSYGLDLAAMSAM